MPDPKILDRPQLVDLFCYRMSRDFPNITHHGADGIEGLMVQAELWSRENYLLGNIAQAEYDEWTRLIAEMRVRVAAPSSEVEERVRAIQRPFLDAFVRALRGFFATHPETRPHPMPDAEHLRPFSEPQD